MPRSAPWLRPSRSATGRRRASPSARARVWVAHGLRGQVSRVDEQFNRVTSTVDVAAPSSRTGSTAVGLGSVWAVFGDSTLARIDPVDARVVGVVVRRRSARRARRREGSGLGEQLRRRHRSAVQSGHVRAGCRTSITVGRQPTGIAFGEGAVWVANTSDDSVDRIDPFTGARRTIPVGRGPTSVAVGAGAVWVANTADIDHLADRSGDERGRRGDRDRQRPVRDYGRPRARLGRRPGAVGRATSGRPPSGRASVAARRSRRAWTRASARSRS